jgi:hypothetical protein
MAFSSTLVGLVIILIILAVALFVLYLYGMKQPIKEKEREMCFINASKICANCTLPPQPKGLKECENTLSQKCKKLLNETEVYISDCSRYIGKAPEIT